MCSASLRWWCYCPSSVSLDCPALVIDGSERCRSVLQSSVTLQTHSRKTWVHSVFVSIISITMNAGPHREWTHISVLRDATKGAWLVVCSPDSSICFIVLGQKHPLDKYTNRHLASALRKHNSVVQYILNMHYMVEKHQMCVFHSCTDAVGQWTANKILFMTVVEERKL